MKAAIKLCLVFVALSLTPGCWNSKDIQNMAYITAIGIDYEDDQFITYVQVLNFSNVAKAESFPIGEQVPIWIGRGKGKTVTESLSSIYATSQLRVFWGHVKAIVCSEKLLKEGAAIRQVYDAMNRYREIRYNILLYGTKEPLIKVLSQKSLLNMSPIDSTLMNYEQSYSQRSFILPNYGYKIIAELNEPGRTAILPSLSIASGTWKEDTADKTMFRIDGAFLFREDVDHILQTWMSEDDLKGIRWMQSKRARTTINVPDDNPAATVVFIKPDYKVKPFLQNGKPYFDVTVKIHGYVDELIEEVSVKKIEELASKEIENEIVATYKKGIAARADVLNLLSHLYRSDPKTYEAQRQSDSFVLDEHSLHSVDVKATIVHSGKYKMRVKP